MHAGAIVVCPHDGPFEQAAIARLRKRIHPVVHAKLFARPVPVNKHMGDTVFNEMFNLPVDRLWACLVIPAKYWLAPRRMRPDRVPTMRNPAREKERADLVR